MVFLRRKASHADKQNIALLETLACTPQFARHPGVGINHSRNAVCDHAALRNPIKALQTQRNFFRNGDWNDSMAEGITVNYARGRFYLTFGQVMDRMQERSALEELHCWQRIAKHLQVSVDDIGLVFCEDTMQSGIHAAVESRSFSQIANFHSMLAQ